jgi:hypothetical protein
VGCAEVLRESGVFASSVRQEFDNARSAGAVTPADTVHVVLSEGAWSFVVEHKDGDQPPANACAVLGTGC